MRQQFILTMGVDLNAASIPAGQTHGVVIDNPSGSWLLLMDQYDYIPPYTIGWARTLPNGAASVTVRFVPGPAGQVSTLAGDVPVVTLDSEPVTPSGGTIAPGAPFVSRLDQPEPLGVVTSITANSSAVSATDIVIATALQRPRVFYVELKIDPGSAAMPGSTRLVYGVECDVFSNVGLASTVIVAHLSINPNQQVDRAILSPPQDLPLGGKLRYEYHAVSAAALVTQAALVTARYGLL